LEELGLLSEFSGTGEKGNSDSILFIGLIARFDPVKDHKTFIKAACLLIEDKPEAHFIMAGKGVEPENALLIKQIPETLLGHFHLLGERNDIERITAALDIACLTSAYGEGFPNTVGEAMACGIPCVVADVGDSARIVAETGLVVPPKDHGVLAAAWGKLIDLKKDGRKRLGLAARERIRSHFELSHIVEQYEQLYSKLVLDGKYR
jgi:glycosyltransferase involved in cell wall biosynthesis